MQSRRDDEKNIKEGDTNMIKFATVIQATPLKVQFDTDTRPSENTYKHLASYSPKVGDRVAFLDDGKNKICIGKVV